MKEQTNRNPGCLGHHIALRDANHWASMSANKSLVYLFVGGSLWTVPNKLATMFIYSKLTPYTVQCHYNAVDFLQFLHNRCPIAHPLGGGRWCLLWVSSMIHALLLSSQCCGKYSDKLDRAITALDYTCIGIRFMITYHKYFGWWRKKIKTINRHWTWNMLAVFNCLE